MKSTSKRIEQQSAGLFASVPIANPHRNIGVSSAGSFRCTFHGCGKTYSQAGHLYRHRLNHAPKHIYVCDFRGCYRSFVRRDLLDRHKARHKSRQASLGKCAHSPQTTCSTGDPSVEAAFSDLLFGQISTAGLGYDRSLNLVTRSCTKPSVVVHSSTSFASSKPHISPLQHKNISSGYSPGQQTEDELSCAQEANQPNLQDGAGETTCRQNAGADVCRFQFTQDFSYKEVNVGFDSDGAYLDDFLDFSDPFHDPGAILPTTLDEAIGGPPTTIPPFSAESANDFHDFTFDPASLPSDLGSSLFTGASTSSVMLAGSVFNGCQLDRPSSGSGDEFTAWLFNEASTVSSAS